MIVLETATSWPDAIIILGVLAVFAFIMWICLRDS